VIIIYYYYYYYSHIILHIRIPIGIMFCYYVVPIATSLPTSHPLPTAPLNHPIEVPRTSLLLSIPPSAALFSDRGRRNRRIVSPVFLSTSRAHLKQKRFRLLLSSVRPVPTVPCSRNPSTRRHYTLCAAVLRSRSFVTRPLCLSWDPLYDYRFCYSSLPSWPDRHPRAFGLTSARWTSDPINITFGIFSYFSVT